MAHRSGHGVFPRGTLLAMPMVVINMGVEMVFILEQRLKAQSISADKSHKVLADVVRTMYSAKFVAELFKPQEVYTNRATRQIFDRLAHSSIMRLNKNSMDKLYDLMTMGFKYQMLRCTCPAQLLHVTLNHLEALKRIVTDGAVGDLIDAAIRQCVDFYARLPLAELFALQMTLARFFQDRRVKVSLFLQDGIQRMDGTIVLDLAGPLPPGTEPPGVVRYFDSRGAKAGSDKLPAIVVPGAVPATPADSSLCVSGEGGARICTLGDNLYAKERKGKPSGPPTARSSSGVGGGIADAVPEPALASSVAAGLSEATVTAAGGGVAAAEGKDADDAFGGADGGRQARAALDLLSSLLGGSGGGGGDAAAPFKLALFSGDDGAGGGGGDGGSGGLIISFDAKDDARLQEMMSRLGLDDAGDARAGGGGGRGGGGKEDDDDLLAMMDAAARS